jgi:hypothetical protein
MNGRVPDKREIFLPGERLSASVEHCYIELLAAAAALSSCVDARKPITTPT